MCIRDRLNKVVTKFFFTVNVGAVTPPIALIMKFAPKAERPGVVCEAVVTGINVLLAGFSDPYKAFESKLGTLK